MGFPTNSSPETDGLGIIKKPVKTECPHCKFLAETFGNHKDSTDREYWLMTEVFVYLHGGDVCEYSTMEVPNHQESPD